MAEPDPSSRYPASHTSDSSSPDLAWTKEFETFYRDTVKQLVGFLLLQNATVIDAADIAQETLYKAFVRWPSLENPRAWSFRVASRALIRKQVDNKECLTADPAALTPLLRSNPTQAWHLRHEVIGALAELPPRQRQVMAWRLSGYKPQEIATELQLSNDTVRSTLYLARRALATRLQEREETT